MLEKEGPESHDLVEQQRELESFVLSRFDVGEYTEALACVLSALQRLPHSARLCNLHGVILATLGDHERAIAAFQAALSLDEGLSSAWHNLGNSLDLLGRTSEAAQAYQKGAARNAGEATEFELAAKGLAPAPLRAPPGFISDYFDAYASRYDDHMARLAYVAHLHLGPLLKSVCGAMPWQKPCQVLDLGCGTGLGGMALREFADKLVGVDLSRNMLAMASQRKTYDALIQAECVDYLQNSQEPYGLIAALDMLIYVGDLYPLFRAAVARLTINGLLALSIELLPTDCLGTPTEEQASEAAKGAPARQDYLLTPHRRFAHALTYVETLGTELGLTLAAKEHIAIRQEGSAKVEGALLIFQKHFGGPSH